MDPRTTLIVVTLMMLFNGGVLGLMHRDLSTQVQPSARDWRIGTLLAAAGCILLATQDVLPIGFVLPLGNASLLVAMALYLRAVRRFDGYADTPWIFLPAVLCTIGVFWASAISPSSAMRAITASFGWIIPSLLAVKSLIDGGRLPTVSGARRAWQGNYAKSRYVLIAMLLIVALLMMVRVIYFSLHIDYATPLLISGQWINTFTMIAPGALPIVGTTVFITLCSERVRAQLQHAAATDYLTGLPNRRTITESANSQIASAQKIGKSITVALVDIDHFKVINDTFGHEVGDDALRHIATVLSEHCTASTIAARLGGEEFLCLIDDAGGDPGTQAERFRTAIEQARFAHPNGTINITVSIGVASSTINEGQLQPTLQRADRALYTAKSQGRNRVVYAQDA
jgi:diguanylate cyclase (GGDEF)-like protein